MKHIDAYKAMSKNHKRGILAALIAGILAIAMGVFFSIVIWDIFPLLMAVAGGFLVAIAELDISGSDEYRALTEE